MAIIARLKPKFPARVLGGTGIDITQTGGVYTFSLGALANDSVTFAKMQDIATDSLIGRDTAGTGDPENILLNATLEMDGSGNLQRAALTGDVAASAGSNTTTIANDVITFGKMQNISTDRLIGRDSASSGDPEEISVGGGLEFTGSGGIQRSALTGNVTASAGSNSTTIANDAVSDAMIRDGGACSVIGRSANSSGDPADISAGTNGHVLRRASNALGFGYIGVANTADFASASSTKFFAGDDLWKAPTVNNLTNYEEGSWTPVLAGSSTAGTQTYTTQVGRYIRIGNLVYVTFRIVLSAKDGTTAGNMRITGLPFTARNVADVYHAVNMAFPALWDLNVAGGYYSVTGSIDPNTAIIALYEAGDNVVPALLTAADFGNTSAMTGAAWYVIN